MWLFGVRTIDSLLALVDVDVLVAVTRSIVVFIVGYHHLAIVCNTLYYYITTLLHS